MRRSSNCRISTATQVHFINPVVDEHGLAAFREVWDTALRKYKVFKFHDIQVIGTDEQFTLTYSMTISFGFGPSFTTDMATSCRGSGRKGQLPARLLRSARRVDAAAWSAELVLPQSLRRAGRLSERAGNLARSRWVLSPVDRRASWRHSCSTLATPARSCG